VARASRVQCQSGSDFWRLAKTNFRRSDLCRLASDLRLPWRAVALRRRQFLFQLMDLLTERRLRDVLALRRIGEATLLCDRNKVAKLMNFHRAILSCERRFV